MANISLFFPSSFHDDDGGGDGGGGAHLDWIYKGLRTWNINMYDNWH